MPKLPEGLAPATPAPKVVKLPTKCFYIRVKRNEGSAHVAAWIIKKDGAVHSGVLYGVAFPETIEALAKATGLPILYEETPWPITLRGGETPALFATAKLEP